MNEAQKKIMIAVAIGLVITFLFPPHAFFLPNGNAIKMGYAFIANIPDRYSMYMLMLLAEWLGIVVQLGGFFILLQNQILLRPEQQANSGIIKSKIHSENTRRRHQNLSTQRAAPQSIHGDDILLE